jgi:Tfp pilus assembly protein PilN
MITINLKPGSRRAAGGRSLAGGLAALKGLPNRVKDPWPMAAVVVVAVTIGFLAWVGINSATRVNTLDEQLATARAENRRFKSFQVEKRRAEAAKDSVVVQIATIRSVDGDRYTWPHILDEVTRAVPPYVWLVELVNIPGPVPTDTTVIAPPQVALQMVGRAMDIQNFTRFMRQLEDSPFLKDVTVVTTQTIIDRGRAVTSFTVKAVYVRQTPESGQPAVPAAGER